MSLTVEQLTEVPFLKTRFLAGRAGGTRPVVWAHTCEVPDPWSWLGTGDLLLTDGYNFPAGPDAQVEFLRQLLEGGMSGIALGEGFHAPPLTPEAAEYADLMAFPVLETAHVVPFVMLAKTVADQNSNRASASLVRILRIYDVHRRLHLAPSEDRKDLLSLLGRESATELHVLDRATRTELLPHPSPMPPDTLRAILDALPGSPHRLPAFTRIPLDEGDVVTVLPLDTDDGAVLTARLATPDARLDLQVLQHAAVVTQIEVERLQSSQHHRSVRGALFFQQLIEGNVNLEDARERLRSFRLTAAPLHVACVAVPQDSGGHVARHLSAQGVPHLLLARETDILLLTGMDWPDPAALSFPEELDAVIGVSSPVHNLGRLPDGVREAGWALETAVSRKLRCCFYESGFPLFSPRTVAEGEQVVADVLGPVLEYDRTNRTELLKTLNAYFAENRSWVRTAELLGIHKQTLIYRIRRIENLTDRSLATLQGQTELYLAARAAERLGRTRTSSEEDVRARS